jgi:hypothetical protein
VVYDQRRGWNEADPSADISTAEKIVDGLTGHKIVVRRVRGYANQSWDLTDGSNILETFVAGNIDIPGIEIELDEGEDLYADGSTNTADSTNLHIQWHYKKVFNAKA